jgi:hypothetical protein
LRCAEAQAAAAVCAGPSNEATAAATANTWSPIATPTVAAEPSPRGRKTPNGKFWIGKSQSGALALSTQLLRLASWVSLSSLMMSA